MWRICQAKDIGTLDITWDEVADILNKELRDDGEYYTSSAYRKKYQQAKLFKDEVFSKETDGEAEKKYQEQRRELEELKWNLRDERREYSASNRNAARINENFRYLTEQLQDVSRVHFAPHSSVMFKSDTDMLLILSDWHIGATFDSSWGKYDSDIAKDRLNQLLEEVKKIQKRHGCENLYISIQGDLLNNNIHKSIAITNRENVIQQVKLCIEYLSSFIYETSKFFNHVHITNTVGNHSRLDRKEDALHDERLDDLIGWTVGMLLKDIENVTLYDNDIDIGIAKMFIRGKEYLHVHGDMDAYTKGGLSNLCMMLGHIPYAVTFGHLHTCSFDDMQGVKMIRGGSLCGAGDSYTIEKRLRGVASQMCCICDENGVQCYYPIELK